MRKVTEYEIIDSGVENCDYFQGIGTGGYEEVFVGSGSSQREALEDALEQAASVGWDVSMLETEVNDASDKDMVQEVLQEHYPRVEFVVRHSSYTGILLPDECFETHDDAREAALKRIKSIQKRGFSVEEIDNDKWEISEGENVSLIPPEAGHLYISSNEDEVDRRIEEINANASLYYYVGVRVTDRVDAEEVA